jgi:hypothetical protein
MTWHQHPAVRRVVRRLRPSPTSFAAAAAFYDPGPLLQLQALRRLRTVSSPTRRRRDGSKVQRHTSSRAITPPSTV